jgi:cell division protein FtsN
MAHQDYISRASKNTKRKNPYKKEPVAQKTGVSLKTKTIILFTVVLITGFAYFLWTIKTNNPVQTPETSTPTKQIKTVELPEPPKEKWEYMEDLKNKQVEVGQYETNKNGPYQMQCGSFRTLKQAEVLKANIAFTGISSQIRKVKGTSGIWYKVILGPYDRKRLAENDKHKLRNNKINYCQIWSWR